MFDSEFTRRPAHANRIRQSLTPVIHRQAHQFFLPWLPLIGATKCKGCSIIQWILNRVARGSKVFAYACCIEYRVNNVPNDPCPMEMVDSKSSNNNVTLDTLDQVREAWSPRFVWFSCTLLLTITVAFQDYCYLYKLFLIPFFVICQEWGKFYSNNNERRTKTVFQGFIFLSINRIK